MSPLVVVSLLFASFVLHTNGQKCDKYIVTVSQENYLENDNIKLHCTFNESVDYSTIQWQTGNDTDTRVAYRDYKGFPNTTGPEPEFKGKLNGRIEDNTHTLTILNATLNDKLDVWVCGVYTAICTIGVEKEWNLNLTKAKWILELYTDNNLANQISSSPTKRTQGPHRVTIETILGYYTRNDDVNVTCESESDRKPVALRIENVKTDSADCLPIAGPYPQPWSCSVTGILSKGFNLKKKSSDVFCEAEFNSEPPIATNKQFMIIIDLSSGEIALVILVIMPVCVVCVGLLICGICLVLLKYF